MNKQWMRVVMAGVVAFSGEVLFAEEAVKADPAAPVAAMDAGKVLAANPVGCGSCSPMAGFMKPEDCVVFTKRKELGLSEEQVVKMTAVLTACMADCLAIQEELKASAELVKVSSAKPGEEEALLKAVKELAAAKAELGAKCAAAQVAVLAILTPEQVKTLDGIKAKAAAEAAGKTGESTATRGCGAGGKGVCPVR